MPVTRIARMKDRGHGMSDAMLAHKAKQYEKARKKAAAFEKQKRGIGKELLEELASRGTLALARPGVGIKDTKQYRTVYDFHGLREEVGHDLADRIRPDAVDPGKLSRMVQDEAISLEVVERHSERVLHAHYPSISLGD